MGPQPLSLEVIALHFWWPDTFLESSWPGISPTYPCPFQPCGFPDLGPWTYVSFFHKWWPSNTSIYSQWLWSVRHSQLTADWQSHGDWSPSASGFRQQRWQPCYSRWYWHWGQIYLLGATPIFSCLEWLEARPQRFALGWSKPPKSRAAMEAIPAPMGLGRGIKWLIQEYRSPLLKMV